jgi:glycine oxidase
MNEQKFDIILVGNGILSLTTAYRLKKSDPNLKIALVGPKDRLGSASLAAGAMINLWAEICEGQFENPALSERFKLAQNGNDLWDDFALELSQYSKEPLKVVRGTYLVLNAKSTEVEDRAVRYIKKSLREQNVDHHLVNPSDVKWLKPAADARALEVVCLPDGRIDSRQVISALDNAMESLGVKVYPLKALSLTPAKRSFLRLSSDHSITLEDGSILTAKNIVLANGTFAQALIDPIDELRKEIPRLLFGGGSGVNLEFPDWVKKYGGMCRHIFDMDVVIRTPDRGGACGLHVVPYGNGSYFLGSSSGVWMDPDILPKIHGIHGLIHSVMTEISRAFFFAGISLRGNGFRPTAIDAFPLLGETNISGIWMINGTKRDGFTMSPYLSREISKAILGEKHTLPSRFQPARKLISYKTKKEAVEAAELMYKGSDFQHGGLVVPYMVDAYSQMRLKQITDVYDKRNIQDFGIHPEVLHLYENDDFYALVNHAREKI